MAAATNGAAAAAAALADIDITPSNLKQRLESSKATKEATQVSSNRFVVLAKDQRASKSRVAPSMY